MIRGIFLAKIMTLKSIMKRATEYSENTPDLFLFAFIVIKRKLVYLNNATTAYSYLYRPMSIPSKRRGSLI